MTNTQKYFSIFILIVVSGFALGVIFKSFVIWVIALLAVLLMSLVWSSRMASEDNDPQAGRRIGWAEFDHTLIGGGRMNVKWVRE